MFKIEYLFFYNRYNKNKLFFCIFNYLPYIAVSNRHKMSKIFFNPERHKEHIVIFRIGNTSCFVTYKNAINHPMISESEFNEGKLLFESEMNKPF